MSFAASMNSTTSAGASAGGVAVPSLFRTAVPPGTVAPGAAAPPLDAAEAEAVKARVAATAIPAIDVSLRGYLGTNS
jgi:hypothetical protein